MEIDQLPDLVLFELFSFLNWEEKLRLKAVCRPLNTLLTGYFNEATKRLFVYRKVISLNETWGSPDQPVQRQELIHLKLFLKFLKFGYFQNVKSLHLFKLNVNYGDPKPIFDEDSRELLFNCLAKLDELFVTNEGKLFNPFDKKQIDLPELKSVSIRYSLGYRSTVLKINSQKLERIVFWARSEQTIDLSHPEKIRYIECLHFTEKVFQGKRFPNLAHLNCLSVDTNFDLSRYPKLRKLEVCPSKEQFENGIHLVKRLLDQKQTLRRSDFEISVFGFKGITPVTLERENKLPGYIRLKLEELNNLEDKFSSFVGQLPWAISTLITPAVEKALGSLPGSVHRFIQQLNINRVTLSRNPNPALAIQFLKEINGVRSLWISECSYSNNEFYDQLGSVPCIQFLEFSDSQTSAVISYDFIAAIRYLRAICINDCFLSLEELGRVIERCEVKYFILSRNWRSFSKRINFEAKIQSKKPFTVHFRGYQSNYETWKEAVAFIRKCERISERPLSEGGRWYPFVEIDMELQNLNEVNL